VELRIRALAEDDIHEVVRVSLLAWEPVFASWRQILGPRLYPIAIYPDWRRSQKALVERTCSDEGVITWIAELSGEIVGFVSWRMDHASKKGEIELLAVAPRHQNRGIGTELNTFALRKLKEGGMRLAVVGTGGDEGHAPARRCYEKAGYTALPLVRYYKEL
jgi:ribosomal protein S18 acetylase RimI-like enzyme